MHSQKQQFSIWRGTKERKKNMFLLFVDCRLYFIHILCICKDWNNSQKRWNLAPTWIAALDLVSCISNKRPWKKQYTMCWMTNLLATWTYVFVFIDACASWTSYWVLNYNNLVFIFQLTIGSHISVHSSRYEARGKFGEHERCIRVARGIAESNSSFLNTL